MTTQTVSPSAVEEIQEIIEKVSFTAMVRLNVISQSVYEFLSARSLAEDLARLRETSPSLIGSLTRIANTEDEYLRCQQFAEWLFQPILTLAVKSGEVSYMDDGSYRGKVRLFTSDNGQLGFLPKGRKRNGYILNIDLATLSKIAKLGVTSSADEPSIDDINWRKLSKYRKMAQHARNKENSWIRDCLKIPECRSDWESAGSKPLFEHSITTGTRIDGQVITVDRLRKHLPHDVEAFLNAWQYAMSGQIKKDCLAGNLQHGFTTNRSWAEARTGEVIEPDPECEMVSLRTQKRAFAGYEASLTIWGNALHPESLNASLSLEYAGTSNGYYYLLINDDKFIAYDID